MAIKIDAYSQFYAIRGKMEDLNIMEKEDGSSYFFIGLTPNKAIEIANVIHNKEMDKAKDGR